MEYGTMDKPERIQRLPHYKGLPITAITMIDDEGVPNFKSVDHLKIRKMKNEKCCGICGEKLDYWMAFMVSEEEAKTRYVFESPNHVECLKYAFNICPWIFYSKQRYSEVDKMNEIYNEKGYTILATHPDRETMNERPQKLGIYVCRGYENVIHKGYRVCKVSPAKSIEWVEGKSH